MENTINWLSTSSPYTEYRTRLDILGESETDESVMAARKAMLNDPKVKALFNEITNWPGSVLTSHKSAGHALHKLVFLADLGLTINDPGMDVIVSRVMDHQDKSGPFQTLANIPTHFGGSGKDVWAWALCDAPSILYALVNFGLKDDPRVIKGIDMLTSLVRENGWPCAVSQEMGTFRGPGKKSDPCPYATLIMLKLLAAIPELRETEAVRQGAEALLNCWTERKTSHPYIFYMGDDFCKLKAPLVWYDILHVTSVLSQLTWLRSDARFNEMKQIVSSKADSEGRQIPESVWMAWKEWDFGQKKVPSPWLTLLAMKVLQT